MAYKPVQAISRGLRVLTAVSELGPIGASKIASRLGIPQPTVVRILDTLMAEGFVHRLPNTASFRVTARVLTLSRGYDPTDSLTERAGPILDQLTEQIGWPLNLGVFDRDAMIIAHTNREANAFSVPGRLGARIPMLATGMGLAYLSVLDPGARETILERLRVSDDTWDRLPILWENLVERLDATRNAGFAVSNEQYVDAVYRSRIFAIAVPIRDKEKVYGCLSALVLRATTNPKAAEKMLVVPLKKTADKLAGTMR